MGWKERVVSYTPAILATIAVVCGTAANIYCETIQFPKADSESVILAGVWSYRTRDYVEIGGQNWAFVTCRSYNYLDRDLGFDYDVDAKTRTVMVFSILAPVIGGVALIWAWLVPCGGSPSLARWRMLGNVFIFVCLLQGLTLLIQGSSLCLDNPVLQYLDSENLNVRESFGAECEWGPGYRLGITGTVFWFIAGISYYAIPPPRVSNREEPQSQTVTYQRNLDGTVEEGNVVVVKGNAVTTQPVPEEASLKEEDMKK